MTTKRNCKNTCQAARLEHTIKLMQIQLERIAVRLCRTHKCHPKIGLDEDYTEICEVIVGAEKDIQTSREEYDVLNVYSPFGELEHYDHDEALEFEENETKDRAA